MRPILLSRGSRSFKESVTTRTLTVSPTPMKRLESWQIEPGVLLIEVDILVRDLAHVQHGIYGPEADKCPETRGLHDKTFDHFLQGKPEYEPLERYVIIHAAISGHDLTLTDVIDSGHGNEDSQFLIDASFELFLKDIQNDLVQFFAQPEGGTLTLSSSIIL